MSIQCTLLLLVRFYHCNKYSYFKFVPMCIAEFNSRLFG